LDDFLLSTTAAAQVGNLDYPSFRNTTPVVVKASQIVIRNDQGTRNISSILPIDRGGTTAETVGRYLRARLKADGTGSPLYITIARAHVMDQGKTSLGNTREYIEIELDVSTAASDFHTTQKHAYVVSKRSSTGMGSRLGKLPINTNTDDMKEVVEVLDRRLLEALKHELQVVQ
jgi:hypothetical protein